MKHLLPLPAMDAIANARSILVAAGFDGAICPLTDKPDIVCASGRTARALDRVARLRGVTLAVLSGASLPRIRTLIGVDAIFAGNDGLEIGGNGFQFVHPEAERLCPQMQEMCHAIEEAVGGWPGAWVENKRLTAAVHVRNCPVDDWNAIRDAIRLVVRPVDDVFCLRGGRAAFEIAPRIGWDKGSALKYIERELAIEDALTLCIGDDDSDEPMFRAVTNGITVRIAPTGETDALYSLPDTAALTALLEWIADMPSSTSRTSYRLSGMAMARPAGI
jgi:trehalose 6-phosphate phosphatase